jgi:hypothetical protein
MRHKWVVAITDEKFLKATPRLITLGFKDRITKDKNGNPVDKAHDKGFKYPRYVYIWTILLWIPLILIATWPYFNIK